MTLREWGHAPAGSRSGTARATRRLLVLCAIAGLVLAAAGSVSAGSQPTGERTFQNNRLEPAYNAANPGQVGYFMEPAGQMHASPTAWAPIYVVVYPTGSTVATGTTFDCMHYGPGDDNCPSHGNTIAGLAQNYTDTNNPTQAADVRAVYANGVAGHDHVLDFPGGDDFNIAWEPNVVLFANADAANEHLLSDSRILELQQAGQVVIKPLPAKTFLCAIVPQRIWDMATPVPNG